MADEKTAGTTSPEESLQHAVERARAVNEQVLQIAAKAGRFENSNSAQRMAGCSALAILK